MELIKILPDSKPFENCKSIPCKQGVYFLWSETELLYIGESQDVNNRVRQHLGNQAEKSVNPKEVKFVYFEIIDFCKDVEDELLMHFETKHNFNPFQGKTDTLKLSEETKKRILEVNL